MVYTWLMFHIYDYERASPNKPQELSFNPANDDFRSGDIIHGKMPCWWLLRCWLGRSKPAKWVPNPHEFCSIFGGQLDVEWLNPYVLILRIPILHFAWVHFAYFAILLATCRAWCGMPRVPWVHTIHTRHENWRVCFGLWPLGTKSSILDGEFPWNKPTSYRGSLSSGTPIWL